jgi:ribosomal protein L37AE/L43A
MGDILNHFSNFFRYRHPSAGIQRMMTMPFEIKEQPKEKACIQCQTQMVYKSLGTGFYIWRCPNCGYKETLAPLIVERGSLQNLANAL